MELLVYWAVVVASALGLITWQHVRNPLRDVPGPFLARWTDWWYMWHLFRGDFERVNQDLHKKHGSIVRYGANRYSICEASALKTIYGPGSQFAKSNWYSSWASPGSWSLFADQDIKRHSRGRSLLQSTYSMSALVNYELFVDEGADLFERRLHDIAETGEAVDMRHWFQCYAFDIIGAITYGQRFGFLDNGKDIESLMSVLDGHLSYATIAGLVPSLHPFLYALRDWWAGRKGSGRGSLLRFTLQRLKQHNDELGSSKTDDMEDHDRPQSFLSKFLSKNSQDPTKFTHGHVVASCISNIVAGSDTTAISLSAILYYLLVTPECLDKLRDEIAAFDADGRLSSKPTFKETQQMPYLQAVIKEALRMHPATGLPLERVVPTGGATICGRLFPAGTIVGCNSWVEHRNTSVFGDDAYQFRPERWLLEDDEALSRMNRHYMPFGLGSRTCIGRHISMLEMTKLIPRVIRDFDFELRGDDGLSNLAQGPWKTQNVWFVKPISFKVKIKARSAPSPEA